MGLILTYEDELYMEPVGSYGEETKIVKIISKYEKPSYDSWVNFQDADCDNKHFDFGDVVQIRGTNETLVFVCKRKRFSYFCQLGSDTCFEGFKRLPSEKIFKKKGKLIKLKRIKLLDNISEALEIDKYIPKEIKDNIQTLVKSK